MFGLFKKKEQELPAFTELKNSKLKDLYFTREAQWDWPKKNEIYVIDNNAPRMITMDPWPQLIFLEAKGQKTVSSFVYYMASRYTKKEPIPEKLDAMILQIISNLHKDGLIGLYAESHELPYYIDLPKSQQDLEKATQLMKKDGFIKE